MEPQDQSQSEPETPVAVNQFDPATLQAMIDHAVNLRMAETDAIIKQQQATIEAMQQSVRGSVPTFTPEHGGGTGLDIAETWSQWEQEMAHAEAEEKRRALRKVASS